MKLGPNYGHGHVTPRTDGALARCGGPAICSVCALEKTRMDADKKHLVESVFGKEPAVKCQTCKDEGLIISLKRPYDPSHQYTKDCPEKCEAWQRKFGNKQEIEE